MEISLKNIGKIKEADIEIKGITIIAGENNTGKSTVGKALFSVFNSLYNKDSKYQSDKDSRIINLLDNMIYELDNSMNYNISYNCLDYILKYLYQIQDIIFDDVKVKIYDILTSEIPNLNFNKENQIFNNTIINIINILNIPKDDYFKSLVQRNLNKEFNNQVKNLFILENSEIELKIQNYSTNIIIDKESKYLISNNDINLSTQVIYIDSPFILDNINNFSGKDMIYHREHLISKLNKENTQSVIEEIILTKKLDIIESKINEVCDGSIISRGVSKFYVPKGSSVEFNIINLSPGFKCFLIIKELLKNNTIERNDSIILDEPEIHLHPKWQLKLAEVIVLLQKEFNIHFLVNTHSPYFLDAIETFAEKYRIEDTCKYYLAENEGHVSIIHDVSDNIEEIYLKLSQPFQELENERWCETYDE